MTTSYPCRYVPEHKGHIVRYKKHNYQIATDGKTRCTRCGTPKEA